LFIIGGSKALAKAIRRSFGRHAPIQPVQLTAQTMARGRLGTSAFCLCHGLARERSGGDVL
jgi:hypothetical protein